MMAYWSKTLCFWEFDGSDCVRVFNYGMTYTQLQFKSYAPDEGLEPATLRLKVWCSTNWANRALWVRAVKGRVGCRDACGCTAPRFPCRLANGSVNGIWTQYPGAQARWQVISCRVRTFFYGRASLHAQLSLMRLQMAALSRVRYYFERDSNPGARGGWNFLGQCSAK